MNADGRPDVVFVNQYSGKTGGDVNTHIFWGNPHHYYSAASMTSLPGHGAYDTTVADLNQDGYLDIVLANSYIDSSYVYWGGPDGFAPARRTELKAGPAYCTSAVDLNRDGYLDLVFSGNIDGHPVGTIFWGSASGFSDSHKTVLKLKTLRGATNVVADLNRDGYLDLIFPDEYMGILHIFWGGPDGFAEARSWSRVVSGGEVDLADLNGDGRLDFVIGGGFDAERKSYNTKTRIYSGSPDGTPSFEDVTELESFGTVGLAIADFNRDGNLDLALSNYMSDSTRSLPVFIYWGSKGGHYTNSNRMELPAESSAGIEAVDLNRDGYPELIVHNHLRDGRHSINSYIYWNGPSGFNRDRRSELPNFGPHFAQTLDPGNLYTRRLEEEYISPAIEVAAGKKPETLSWVAEEPHGARIKFQVRSANARESLGKPLWQGPQGAGSFYTTAGAKLHSMSGEDRWIQYRAVFTSPDAGEWPALSEVDIKLRR